MNSSTALLTRDPGAEKIRDDRLKVLWSLRLLISKALVFLTLTSIIIMIVLNQQILEGKYSVCSLTAMTLKRVESGITVLSIVLIWLYTFIQVEIYRLIRNIGSRFIAFQVNINRNCLLLLETLVTLPHPLPYCFGYGFAADPSVHISDHESDERVYTTNHTSTYNLTTTPSTTITTGTGYNATTSHILTGSTTTNSTGLAVPTGHIRLSSTDSVLSILMFLRLYQIARLTVLHSHQFRTTLSYSLGALAKTKYNFTFIFKSLMSIYKGYFLGALAFIFTMIASWCIFVCDQEIASFSDALWVVVITFFTVGYGDLYPVSMCSQSIAVLTGFSGMFFMGISITILSRYLQLTYDEYCMLSFIIEADIQKTVNNASASIIQAAWQVHQGEKKANPIQVFKAQRKLIKAMHNKKDVEQEKISSRERRQKQVKISDQLTLLFYTSSEVPLYDMKEQMKKLTVRTDHVLQRNQRLISTMTTMKGTLACMQERLLYLSQITQKEKRPRLKNIATTSHQ